MSLEELVGILIVHKQVLHRDEKKSEGLNIAIKTRQKGKNNRSSKIVVKSNEELDEFDYEGDDKLNLLRGKFKQNSWIWKKLEIQRQGQRESYVL